jgi:hypothetical protein
MQPRLQLTEDQYNHWSAQQQALLVEFGSAHKIGVISLAPDKTTGRPDWLAFEALDLMAEEKVSDEHQTVNPTCKKGAPHV